MRLAGSPTQKNIPKSHIESAKKTCVASDSNGDEPEEEEEEKTAKVPTIRIALRIADE